MLKYYYEKEDHDAFMAHCKEDCSNVEYCYFDEDGRVMSGRVGRMTTAALDRRIASGNYHPYRCYVVVPDETPATKDTGRRLTADGMEVSNFVKALRDGRKAQTKLSLVGWHDVDGDIESVLVIMLIDNDLSKWRLKPIDPPAPKVPVVPEWFKAGTMVAIKPLENQVVGDIVSIFGSMAKIRPIIDSYSYAELVPVKLRSYTAEELDKIVLEERRPAFVISKHHPNRRWHVDTWADGEVRPLGSDEVVWADNGKAFGVWVPVEDVE